MTVTNVVQQSQRWSEQVLVMSAYLDTVGDVFGGEIDLTGFQSISVQVVAGNGAVAFECSNDAAAGTFTNKQLTPSVGGSSQGQSSGVNTYSGDLGSNRFRVRAVTINSGPLAVEITAYPQSFVPIGISTPVNSLTPGTSAVQLGKAEDAPAANGDVGVAILGQRAFVAPAILTSAQGDYGHIQISAEGKIVNAGQGAEENTWQNGITITNVTTISDIAIAQASGIRNYLTDLVVSNKNAAAVDFQIYNGLSVVGIITVPAGATLVLSFATPIKSTTATRLGINTPTAAAAAMTFIGTGYIGV